METQGKKQLNLYRRRLRRRVKIWEDGEGHLGQTEEHVQWDRGMEEGGRFKKASLFVSA